MPWTAEQKRADRLQKAIKKGRVCTTTLRTQDAQRPKQLKAEHFRNKLADKWCADDSNEPILAEIAQMMIGMQAVHCDRVEITGIGLRKFARKSNKKAPGADDWICSELIRLPLPCFEDLARIVNLILDG